MGFYRKEIKMEEKTVTEPDKELSTPMEVAQKMDDERKGVSNEC